MLMMMALWLCTAQLNEARFTGGFLQYDWMCSSLSALALYHKGRHKSAGVALSWGAMTRVFPGFFIFGIALKALVDMVRRGPRTQGAGWQHRGPFALVRREHWNFLLAFTMACGVLFAASHMTGRGTQTWPEWVDKIGRHSGLHAVTSNQRIGVGRLVIHRRTARRFFGEVKGHRLAKVAASHDRKRALQVLALLLLIPALIRRRDEDAFILMLFAVFAGVTLSRYYASVWVMLFALGAGPPRGDPGNVGRASLTSYTALIAGSVLLLLNAGFYVPERTTAAYFIINYAIFGLFCALCVGYLVADVWAWWRSKRGGGGGVKPSV